MNYIAEPVLFCNNQRDVNDGEWRGRNDKGGNEISILKEFIFQGLTLEK